MAHGGVSGETPPKELSPEHGLVVSGLSGSLPLAVCQSLWLLDSHRGFLGHVVFVVYIIHKTPAGVRFHLSFSFYRLFTQNTYCEGRSETQQNILNVRQSPTPTMAYTTLWRKLSASQLNFAIQAFSLISIFFEGYDQGVMGGVNSSPRYVQEVGIGTPDGKITDTTHEGGIVSIYYLGCIVGCFVGGWLADRIGRING